MRTLLYTLIFTLALVSCKSIETMVEKGEYEKAFSHAVDKLAGEKNKKTKYVKGLEKAYIELNSKDLKKIASLERSTSISKWEEIYDIYGRMISRRDKAAALVPLVSEDGYEANLDVADLSTFRLDARDNALEAYYSKGLDMLNTARNNRDKELARDAKLWLEKTERFTASYKDVSLLKREALELGIMHIAIDIKWDKSSEITKTIYDKVVALRLEKLGNEWERYYLFNKNIEYDRYIVVELGNYDFGAERENVNNYEMVAMVEDGLEYLYDDKGKIVKDSLGNKITIPRKVLTKAWVSEIYREKHSNMEARVLLYDELKSLPVVNTPVNVYHEFKDSAISYTGDKRALNKEVLNRLDSHIANFPTDRDAAEILGNYLASGVENAIRKLNIS
ncbi:MAG: hypothetical protein KBF57_13970 [Saprospiraceae bacterium]|nr:hypothetical protein [Saprospiraceae bacterium]MBP9195786.1 hypothetical protein [Saprospiraceae bacterium]